MQTLGEAALATPSAERQDVLMCYAAELAEACEAQLPLQRDRDAVSKRRDEWRAALVNSDVEIRFRDDQGWLGGSA